MSSRISFAPGAVGVVPAVRRLVLIGALFALVACGEGEGGAGDDVFRPSPSPQVAADTGVAPAPIDAGAAPVAPVRMDSGLVPLVPRDSGTLPINPSADASQDAASGSDAGASDASVTPDGGNVVAPEGAIQRGPAEKAYISRAGPYATMSYTSGFKNGANFAGATLYYPTAADAKPPFAYVAICPGFTASQSSIRSWGPFLASHGIVAMTIDTNDPLVDMEARSRALADALESVAGENTRMGSPLVGKLDLARKGSMGWSMGGGGTMILAERDQSLKAAVSLCGYEPGRRFPNVKTPSLLFSATGDGTAAPRSNAQTWYPTLTGKKMLYIVQGGSHSSANNPAGSSGQIGAYGLAWLKIFLEGDERFIPIAKSMPTGVATFENNL